MIAALIGLNRNALLSDLDEAILSAALGVLDDTYAPGEATLKELIAVIRQGPEPLRNVTLAETDERYLPAVEGIVRSLMALCEGALGDTFAHRASVAISLDKPLCIDISRIGEADTKLRSC